MTQLVNILTFCFLTLPLPAAFAATSGGKPLLQGKVFPPVKRSLQRSALFVRVRDGKVIWEKDSARLLAPASVSKLLTAGAVLDRFGPVFHFTTRIFHDGRIRQGVLTGNLYVVGDGDPFLVSEKLWQMAADIRLMGIRSIKGQLIVDHSLFDASHRDASRRSGQYSSRNAYDAPVTALAVNFNTYAVAMAPGGKTGAAGLVGLDPYNLNGVLVENHLRTARAGRGSSISVTRRSGKNKREAIHVKGSIASNVPLKKVYRSVGNPATAAGEQIRAFLHKEGVRISGTIRTGHKPDKATPLYEIKGYPISRIISGLNKYSNNYIADSLVKRLGARDGRPGSLAAGLGEVNRFLQTRARLPAGWVLANGSGLAPENRLSARQVVRLLLYMESRLDIGPEFMTSLAIAGSDGTMKDRFQGAQTRAMQGLVRAKTGTLTEPLSVAGLAGYFRHHHHGLIAFAIIDNGIKGRRQPSVLSLRQAQDQAIRNLWNKLGDKT